MQEGRRERRTRWRDRKSVKNGKEERKVCWTGRVERMERKSGEYAGKEEREEWKGREESVPDRKSGKTRGGRKKEIGKVGQEGGGTSQETEQCYEY